MRDRMRGQEHNKGERERSKSHKIEDPFQVEIESIVEKEEKRHRDKRDKSCKKGEREKSGESFRTERD